ncbi:Protein SPIRAL1-like 1 [Capsicum baccatum]|uniref:Protein SPIRAL1-like 1 n=1 Tax=Capsicum baccatum TaxID=33114 RepID=A0A2G2XS20_CAPBA|nr:Protein SPIRAL1-like 1 [Capsicum baccatum]
MGHGVSAGGGQSSLGYLFGSGELANNFQTTRNVEKAPSNEPTSKPAADSQPVDNTKNVPVGIHSSNTNNYFCADGQNCDNFLMERRLAKIQAAPGGGSSLGYLFGDGSSK